MTITHSEKEHIINPYMLKQDQRIKLNDYYYLDEFVSPAFYKRHVIDNIVFYNKLTPKEVFTQLNLSYPLYLAWTYIREHYGKAVVLNNWGYINVLSSDPSFFSNRGQREQDCKVGAPGSDHKTNSAQDGHVVGVSEKAVNKFVLDNEQVFYDMGIRKLENGTWNEITGEGWVHLGSRETGSNRIVIIPFWKPKTKV